MNKLKVASVFSGCGGMDLGFEGGFEAHKSWLSLTELDQYKKFNNDNFTTLNELPFETVFACDVNQKAKVAWENYFSKRRNVENIFHLKSIVDIVKDIRLKSQEISKNIDVVTGGFPCNDFSVAGKRLGFNSDKSHQGNKKLIQGDDDPSVENRGMLYFWMREFIAEVKPKIFYAENVKGLVSLGNAVEIISNDFSSIKGSSYFLLPVKVLKALDYGVPQTRERVIFIGVSKDHLKDEVRQYLEEHGNLPPELDLYPTTSHNLINDDQYRSFATSQAAFDGLVEPEISNDLAQQSFSRAKFFGKKMQGGAEVNLKKPGPTIRAEHHGNIEFRRLSKECGGVNESEYHLAQRRLSVRECARIQTFPDNYEFVKKNLLSASDGYRLIGNAVPPLLSYRLGQKLANVWPNLFKD